MHILKYCYNHVLRIITSWKCSTSARRAYFKNIITNILLQYKKIIAFSSWSLILHCSVWSKACFKLLNIDKTFHGQRSRRARLPRAVGTDWLCSSSTRLFAGAVGRCNWLWAVSWSCKACVFNLSASKSGFNAAILWLYNVTRGLLFTAAVNCSLTDNSVFSELLFHLSLSLSLSSVFSSVAEVSLSSSLGSSISGLQIMWTCALTSASNLDIVLTSGLAQPIWRMGVWLPSSHLHIPS